MRAANRRLLSLKTLPLLTTFKKAINSRNAIASPTNTIRVAPVVAGCCCCSAFTLVILRSSRANPHHGSLLRTDLGVVLTRSHVRSELNFSLDRFRQLLETLLKRVAIA